MKSAICTNSKCEKEVPLFADYIISQKAPFLMGLAQESEDIIPWLREFEPAKAQIRVAFEYLSTKNPTFQEPINKIMNLIEV